MTSVTLFSFSFPLTWEDVSPGTGMQTGELPAPHASWAGRTGRPSLRVPLRTRRICLGRDGLDTRSHSLPTQGECGAGPGVAWAARLRASTGA